MSDIKDAIGAATAQAAEMEERDAPRYSHRNAAEIAEMELPPQETTFGGIELSGGYLAEIIGPPGIGKTRLAAWIAICQILQTPFPNADYFGNCTRPLKWQFFGTENSIRRWQHDLRKMWPTFSQDERDLLRAYLDLPTLEAADDAYMRLDDDGNVAKLERTLRDFNPNIAVFDPWGDLCADELKDEVQRDTVRTIKRIVRAGENPDVPAIILNHSRMGAKCYASAKTDAGNYGRNSKAIYGQCRTVLNLRPASTDMEQFGREIEILDVKHNDRAGFTPVAVRLDPATMTYQTIPDFDHDALQAAWDEAAADRRKRGGKSEAEREQRKAENAAKVQAAMEAGLRDMFADGGQYQVWDSDTFKARLRETITRARPSPMPSKDEIGNFIACRVSDWREGRGGDLQIAEQREQERDPQTGELRDVPSKRGGKILKGTPEAITAYLSRIRNGGKR